MNKISKNCSKCNREFYSCKCKDTLNENGWKNGKCGKCDLKCYLCKCKGTPNEIEWEEGKCNKCNNFCAKCDCDVPKEEAWLDSKCLIL